MDSLIPHSDEDEDTARFKSSKLRQQESVNSLLDMQALDDDDDDLNKEEQKEGFDGAIDSLFSMENVV